VSVPHQQSADPIAYHFGDPWDAPAWDGAIRVPTPTGEHCAICREMIIDGDRGWIRGTVREIDGQPKASTTPIHVECEALSVIGHMVGVCSCSGADDARFGSLRAASILAWQRLQALSVSSDIRKGD
jgi:hypothetical protein